MLSAFKNFFITFLIAALIFGVVGYFSMTYLSDVVTGILDGNTQSSTPVVNAPEEEPGHNDSGDDENLKVPDGESFTFLVLGTDYRPDIYKTYYRTIEDYQKIIDNANKKTQKKTKSDKKATNKNSKKDDEDPYYKIGELKSILETNVRFIRATWITVVRADKENREYAVCYISPETAVSAPCGESTLGEIYGLYGLDTLCEYLSAMTGLEMDYRFVLDGVKQLDFTESMGDTVSFNLKCDLYAGKKHHLSSPTTEIGGDDEETVDTANSDDITDTTETSEDTEALGSADVDDATSPETSDPDVEIIENIPVLKAGDQLLDSYSIHIVNTFREESQDDINAKSSLIFEVLKQYLTRCAEWSADDLEKIIEDLTYLSPEDLVETPDEDTDDAPDDTESENAENSDESDDNREPSLKYDINDPYSTKPALATEFDADEVEYIHSMLEAIEYFDYVQFIYPGAYSESSNSYQPDIKAALALFEKYRNTSEDFVSEGTDDQSDVTHEDAE